MAGEYRRWRIAGYGGWVDAALFDRMTQRQQSDPDSLFREEGAEVVRSRRNLTIRLPIGGSPVWIKRFRPSGPVDRLAYAHRPGKAAYAWNAAMTLIESGFCTPRPLIGLRSAGRLGGAAGIVAFEEVYDHVPLRRVLADERLESSTRDRVMSGLGGCLRRFHDLGFRHRDLRQANILAARVDGGWSFCFLDLNRLRVQPPLTTIQRLREVEKLNLPRDGLAPFFDAYMPDGDREDLIAAYEGRVAFADRLEHLPLGRLLRKAWYYGWELRAFSRARRP
jgi:hypothetical protein